MPSGSCDFRTAYALKTTSDPRGMIEREGELLYLTPLFRSLISTPRAPELASSFFPHLRRPGEFG